MVALKRRISIINIAAVTKTTEASLEFVIHVPTEYDYRYLSERYYSRANQNRRSEIISLLQTLYYKLHAKDLPVYAVPARNLKEFAGKKSDKKRNKYTIPDEKYRVANQKPQQDPHKFVEGFEEEKGKSKGIYQRDSLEKTVTLDDFKLIKCLGKGSFGTVYLAQKTGSTEFYAIKKLGKNMLIQSGSIECTLLEKEILKTIYHPFLVALEFAFQTPTDIYFVMKYYA